jgi:hypothetical protein
MTVVTVRIRDLAQARQALTRHAGTEILLVTDPEVTAVAGVGFWRALEEELGHPVVVDCGEDAGLAMAALRAGCRDLLFTGSTELAVRLEGMAVQVGAILRHGATALEPRDEHP